MGLVLTRRVDQELVLLAAEGVDPSDLAEQLKAGITIKIESIRDDRASLHIWAPKAVTILRSELLTQKT